MKLSDMIRQLNEAKGLYGDLPVMVRTPSCSHPTSARHFQDCFDEASMELTEVGERTNTRMVVIK